MAVKSNNIVKLPEKRQPGLWRGLHNLVRALGRRGFSPLRQRPNPFAPAKPLPGVIGEGRKPPALAMDAAAHWAKLAQDEDVGADWGWLSVNAGNYAQSMYSEGQEWLGYAILALLSQRPEYRIMVDTVATEMTREWIVFKSKSGDKNLQDRIEKIEQRLKELKFQQVMKSANVNDGFQGRGQVYVDTGEPDNRDELKLPLSDIKAVKAKYGRGKFITRLGAIEPIWCYPAAYEASDPLRANWYKPDLWWVMGKEVSRDRLLTFVGNEVPDIIKPAYSFGGIATTQMAKPYVDFWLRNRTSESDLLNNFSLRVLATDLDVTTADEGGELFQRVLTLNTFADNQGTLLINKQSEDFNIRQTSLGGVSEIVKQSMERMTIPSRMPIVKFFGNQPSGLNADSEGVIRMWYDDIKAAQESRNRETMQRIIDLVQIELFDEIIDDLTWEYKDLWQLDEAGRAAIQLTKAQIVQTDVAGGIIDPEEGRLARAKDEDSPYIGLDLESREAPGEEMEEKTGEAGSLGGGLINPKPQTNTSQRLARSVEEQGAEFGGAETGGFAAHDYALDKAEWVEHLHPRDENGKFAKKGEVEPSLHKILEKHGFTQHPESPHAVYHHPSGNQIVFAPPPPAGGKSYRWKTYKDYLIHPKNYEYISGKGTHSNQLSEMLDKLDLTIPPETKAESKPVASGPSGKWSTEASFLKENGWEFISSSEFGDDLYKKEGVGSIILHKNGDWSGYDAEGKPSDKSYTKFIESSPPLALVTVSSSLDILQQNLTKAIASEYYGISSSSAEEDAIKAVEEFKKKYGAEAPMPSEGELAQLLYELGIPDEKASEIAKSTFELMNESVVGAEGLTPDLEEKIKNFMIEGHYASLKGANSWISNAKSSPLPPLEYLQRAFANFLSPSAKVKFNEILEGGSGPKAALSPTPDLKTKLDSIIKTATEVWKNTHKYTLLKNAASKAAEDELAGLGFTTTELNDLSISVALGVSDNLSSEFISSKAEEYAKAYLKEKAPELPPAAEPPVKTAALKPDPVATKELKQVGGQLGSNPGGVYEDANGQRYYIKQTKSPARARNENLAASLYALAGAGTLQYRNVSDNDTAVVTEWHDLSANNIDKLSPAQREVAQLDFAIHAWLANWDAVGLAGDNIGATADGKVISLDLGGALAYRAQGSPKGEAFGGSATEWDTLRDPSKNPQAAALFKDMSPETLKKSAERLKGISGADIYAAIKQAGYPEEDVSSLAQKLMDRRNYIIKRASSPSRPLWNPPFSTGSDPHLIITKLSDSAPKSSSQQKSAISSYTNGGYKYINSALRFGFISGSHTYSDDIKHLTSWLDKAALPEETIVNRKVSGDYAIFLKQQAAIGSEFIDYGFASSSVNPGTWSGEMTMVIRLPAGAKAASVQHISDHKSEYEVLIQRGTKYIVKDYNPKTKTLYCEIDQTHLAKPQES